MITISNSQKKQHVRAQAFLARIAAVGWADRITMITSPKTRVEGYAIHPCVVEGQDALIHARDLPQRDPHFYQRLQAFAESESYRLIAERRHQDSSIGIDRRSILPIVAFTVGMNSMVAARDLDHDNATSQTDLALFDTQITQELSATELSNRPSELKPEPIIEHDHALDWDKPNLIDTDMAADISDILHRHYVYADDDPEYIESDLLEMAEYFSRYPEAVKLLKSLDGQAWRLHFSKDTFKTEVRGSQLQVHSANVHFDSRAAAQLRSHKACSEKLGACIASPADALLHELLHAHSALLSPSEFIAQGGMNSVLYPYAHEMHVIKNENSLYNSMTAIDGRIRPYRHAHSGRLAASSCVTCIE